MVSLESHDDAELQDIAILNATTLQTPKLMFVSIVNHKTKSNGKTSC